MFGPQQFRSVLLCQRHTDTLGTLRLVQFLSPGLWRRQYSERKVVVCPYRTRTLRTSFNPWFCGYRRGTLRTGYEPKYMSLARINLLIRSGHATPILLGGNLSRSSMSSSPPTLPADTSCRTFRSILRHCRNFQSAGCVTGICSREGSQCRRTVWTRRKWTLQLERESQAFSTRNSIPEDMARSEVEAMEATLCVHPTLRRRSLHGFVFVVPEHIHLSQELEKCFSLLPKKLRVFCDTWNASVKKTELVDGGSTKIESKKEIPIVEKNPIRVALGVGFQLRYEMY